jgi:hypothetical protein
MPVLHEAMHDDFNQNASISGLVSYLYFPRVDGVPVGHTAVEVEGDVISVTLGRLSIFKLSNLIDKAYAGGMPFFRFFMTVTPEQLQMLREHAREKTSILCSHASYYTVTHCGLSIPFPCMIAPSLSALCLTKMYYDHPEIINRIEFYGPKNALLHGVNMTIGVAGECASGVFTVFASWMIVKYLTHCLPVQWSRCLDTYSIAS